jgi:hypothetical protein
MRCHYLAGARTMNAPSSTPPATSATICPSGNKWKHSQAAATHKRSTNPSYSSTWRLGSHMVVHRAVAAVGSATARRTLTVPRASNACRHWHSLSIRPVGCQACYECVAVWHQIEAFVSSSGPHKIYQPQLFEHMAARVPHSSSPGCSSRGECYCTDDSHCAKGQQCLPSLAFPEYRACRLPGLL